MTSADKFGIAFAIGITAVMIGLISGGTFETSQPSPIQSAPTQTYSPPPQAAVEESAPAQAPIMTPSDDDLTDVLSYNIRGAVVDSIVGDSDNNSVNVLIDARLDGNLTITISSSVVEPFADGTYFVLVDGEEIHDFTQTGSILSIPFLAGATEVTILGITDDYVAAQAADKAAADKAAADKAAADKAAAEAAAKAAAAPMSAEVVPVAGSATPGCEPECYDPSTVTISAGGTVTFVNSDTAPHTVTSGTATDGPDGVWDSSLIMMDMSYSVTLDNSGTYDYFCMVHPWMQGIVIVE